MNVGQKYTVKPGFHRIGDRYGHLIDDTHILGRDPLGDLRLTKKRIPVNILSTEEFLALEIPVPGYKKEDISIEIEDHILTIKGERSLEKDRPDTEYISREHNFAEFERSFELNKAVDEDHIIARVENGMLVIQLYMMTAPDEHHISHIEVK